MKRFVAGILLLLVCLAVDAAAQTRQPGPIQKPGEIQKINDKPWKVPGPIQKPGEIQTPKGELQKPGEIQTPKGIEAITRTTTNCQQRLSVGADALFAFNKFTLTADAEETLRELGPMILEAGKHPIIVEGHTDGIGTAAYNQTLSERRAQTVKDWLVAHNYGLANGTIKGYGKNRPVAANTNADGSDRPEGRRLNRRVEIVIDTCH